MGPTSLHRLGLGRVVEGQCWNFRVAIPHKHWLIHYQSVHTTKGKPTDFSHWSHEVAYNMNISCWTMICVFIHLDSIFGPPWCLSCGAVGSVGGIRCHSTHHGQFASLGAGERPRLWDGGGAVWIEGFGDLGRWIWVDAPNISEHFV